MQCSPEPSGTFLKENSTNCLATAALCTQTVDNMSEHMAWRTALSWQEDRLRVLADLFQLSLVNIYAYHKKSATHSSVTECFC